MEQQEKKSSFFLRNLLKGLVWLAIIVAMFVFTKHNVNKELLLKFEPFFEKTALILVIFCLSELIIGIIPPEFFLIWALRRGDADYYITFVVIFILISYTAGFLAYLFGRYLHTTRVYRYLRDKYLSRTEVLLQTYGLYLIMVAALTPLPFSGVAMLVGAVGYPTKRYIYWSLTRFFRFALSGYVIWEANTI